MRVNNRHPYNNMDLVKICRYAVERSCGHLEDIEIVSFCNGDLLQTIVSWFIRTSKQNVTNQAYVEGSIWKDYILEVVSTLASYYHPPIFHRGEQEFRITMMEEKIF
ncbi:hypothetical protein MtrunA17_Chr3g0111391 [Medicago truncatula]|uniref:Uncharacterized protein n=1 Tax=Medicago truncatula TaxID=3880 RepID=A0A396IU41_MEDTR|nr:hypothetical protein MtrunA17_Chr3g0111391 [Medicago truncatula]